MAEARVVEARVVEARVGAVQVAVLDGPLSGSRAAGLADVLRRSAADAGVGALVILCLPAKAGLPGTDDLPDSPDPLGLSAAVAALRKPVVVALSGAVAGLWFGVALAATERICDPGCSFACPEIGIGLVPGGGVTQRLPRLIGASEALRLLLTGAPVGAAEAVALGLVDRVAEGDLATAAVAQAAALIGNAAALAPRSPGFRDARSYQAAVRAARQALRSERMPAPAQIVECVEAALLLPPEQGVAFESAIWADLAASDEAAGLAYARKARAGLRAGVLRGATGPEVTALSVWGAGGHAAALVRLALMAGLRVNLCDPDREALISGLEQIAAAQETAVVAGTLSPEDRDADWARLTPWLEPVAEGPVFLCPGGADWVDGPDRAARQPDLLIRVDVGAGLSALAVAQAEIASGGLVELVLDQPDLSHPGLGVLYQLGLVGLSCGADGPVVLRLRQALAAAIAHLEAQGLARGTITAALAARGLLGGTPAPRGLAEQPQAALIVARCVAAMANAGANLLHVGAVHSPHQVDILAIEGRIYPEWAGGPLFQADRRGLLLLLRDLRLWAGDAPQIWAPSPLIEALVADGRRFAELPVSRG